MKSFSQNNASELLAILSLDVIAESPSRAVMGNSEPVGELCAKTVARCGICQNFQQTFH
jgi:hypothetical protein